MSVPDRSEERCLTRRGVIALGVGAFAVAALPLLRRSRTKLTRRSLPVMGTIAEIAVLHRDPLYAHAAIDAAMDELSSVERRMTRFSPTSDVGRANLEAARSPVRIDPATFVVLTSALRWAETTEGAFDPCIGRAIELWDVTRRVQPPQADQVRRLAGRRLYRALDLARHRGSPVVHFGNADVEIDLGGIAKGYGVDRAVQTLREWRIRQALVNVGGDLYALGASADGPWQVGIRSPRDPSTLAGTVAVCDRAVATSGDYLQFFEYRGRRYHHLLDPRTGAPRLSAMHSVTIEADSCMAADAAATAVFGLPQWQADQLLRVAAPDSRFVWAA